MEAYKELLAFSKERVSEFFGKTDLFEGQFEFSEFNELCYKQMYLNNDIDNPKSVKELKSEIEGLKELCKKCGQYYMVKRNESVVKFDLQMGRLFEDLIVDFLNQNYRIKALHADQSNKSYPDCMILNSNKSILAYFEVKYHGAPFLTSIHKTNRFCYEGSITLDYKKLIKQLEIIESDLDRPVFYLHWVDFPCLKGIFFETSEQVKENLYKSGSAFERKEREGDKTKSPASVYLGKFYSPLLEMGSFEEFINMIRELKG